MYEKKIRCWCEYTNETGEILKERNIVVKYFDELSKACSDLHGKETGYKYVRDGEIINDNVFDYFISNKKLYYIAYMGNEFVEVEKFNFLGNCFKLIEKYTVLDCIDLPHSNEDFENMRFNYDWKIIKL